MSFQNIEEVTDRHLHILWTNADPLTSEHMVMMYARNALLNEWWDKITIIVWGATQKLLLENEAVKLKADLARQVGVEFTACISCAVNLGIKEELEEADVEVIRWGEKLSLLMQNGKHVLSI